jgi:hypothetical protein
MRSSATLLTILALAVAPAAADTAKKPDVKAPAVTAADDWETPLMEKRSSVLKFGGDEWQFRASFKNKGKLKTSGKELSARITATAGSATLFSTTVSLRPGSIGPGSAYTYDFKFKSPLKSDAKVLKIVFDAGDGLRSTQEFQVGK